jgi:hypothetical protein
MIAPMDEKTVRKPRNEKIDPWAFSRARVEILNSRKTLDEWLEEAIEEAIIEKIGMCSDFYGSYIHRC